MTTNAKSIYNTPGYFGEILSAVAGSGGVTVGLPVKLSDDRTVVLATAYNDKIIGIAGNTAAEGYAVQVIGNGNLVTVPYTLTSASLVQCDGGDLADYTSGTIVGYVWASATSASIVKIQLQY